MKDLNEIDDYIARLVEVQETKSCIYLIIDYDVKRESMLNYQKFVKGAMKNISSKRDKLRMEARRLKKQKSKETGQRHVCNLVAFLRAMILKQIKQSELEE
jgi:hypothetical protein